MQRSKGLMLLLAGLCFLLGAGPLGAAEYYLDAVSGQDGNNGSMEAPWRSWSRARTVLAPGDTLYCSGPLGQVQITAADPVGTAGLPITYARWAGRAMPHIATLVFDGTSKDAYLVFDGFKFDPGYVTSAGFEENNAVNLDGASHITFDNCYFEGPKLAGATGDFAPYCVPNSNNPPTITAGHPGNASYITIRNSQFSYSSTSIRVTENSATKVARHWEIVDNDLQEAAEDLILLADGGGSDSVIARNYLHDQVAYRSAFRWPGTATGDWGSAGSFAPVTQDVSGASAMFYELSGGSIFLLPDDKDHLVARNTSHVWRLDADPANVYFTPSGNGDSTHGDCVAVQGPTRNVLIERNRMETMPAGGQALKLDYVLANPQNITVQNNLFYSRTTAPTYLILIEGGSNSLFRHNTIYPGPGAPLARGLRFIENPGGAYQNLRFYNNIISGAVLSAGTAILDYNCWMSTPPAGLNEGPNSIIVAGLSGVGIVDEANLDFHLLSDSVARDKGNPDQAPGVTAGHPQGVDFDGLDRDSIPDMGAYEYGAAPPQISAWYSVASHGGSEIAVQITEGGIESRLAAITKLQINFSSTLDAATVNSSTVSITGDTSGDLAGRISGVSLVDGYKIVVTLGDALPDGERFTLAVSPTVTDNLGHTVCGDLDLRMAVLAGDVDGSGAVDALDMLAIRVRSGRTVTSDTAGYDIDASGQITTADLRLLRSHLGNSLP